MFKHILWAQEMNKNKQYFKEKNLCVNQKVRSLNLITALPIPPQGKPEDTITISVLVSKEWMHTQHAAGQVQVWLKPGIKQLTRQCCLEILKTNQSMFNDACLKASTRSMTLLFSGFLCNQTYQWTCKEKGKESYDFQCENYRNQSETLEYI